VEKRVVGLKNPAFELPNEDSDDVGIDEAPDLGFTAFEVAIESRIL
jgi:hypothetical protein